MSAILNRQKAKKLRSRLLEMEVFEPEIDNRECLNSLTLALAKNAVRTTLAYHDLADIADRYIKEIETRIELGHVVLESDLRFMNEFSQELAKA